MKSRNTILLGTFEFKNRDGNWYLESPVKDRAESMNLTALFTTAESLNWSAVNMPKDGREALKEYGLAKGELSVKFTGKKGLDEYSDRDSLEVLVGKDAAVEGRVYYRVEGVDIAYTGSKRIERPARPCGQRDQGLAQPHVERCDRFAGKQAHPQDCERRTRTRETRRQLVIHKAIQGARR
jgi:hypothetical protein